MSRKLIAVVDDLFFASKIRGAAERADVRVIFAKNLESVIETARRERPSLVLASLHARDCDPVELANELKSDKVLSSIRLIGFFSHVDTEMQKRAVAAGFDMTLPNSSFSQRLPEILAESLTDI